MLVLRREGVDIARERWPNTAKRCAFRVRCSANGRRPCRPEGPRRPGCFPREPRWKSRVRQAVPNKGDVRIHACRSRFRASRSISLTRCAPAWPTNSITSPASISITRLEAHVTFSRARSFFTCDINVHAGRGLTLRGEGEAADAHSARSTTPRSTSPSACAATAVGSTSTRATSGGPRERPEAGDASTCCARTRLPRRPPPDGDEKAPADAYARGVCDRDRRGT